MLNLPNQQANAKGRLQVHDNIHRSFWWRSEQESGRAFQG
eukprot:COSAG01_NODE_73074_length_251_cov_0.677632_1_plen_39_part_01